MKHTQEFIDEVVAAYKRVKNKAFISRKYNISMVTVQRWIEDHELKENKEEYTKILQQKAEILKFYNQSGQDAVATAEKFNLQKRNLHGLMERYSLEVFYKTPKYDAIIRKLNKFKSACQAPKLYYCFSHRDICRRYKDCSTPKKL